MLSIDDMNRCSCIWFQDGSDTPHGGSGGGGGDGTTRSQYPPPSVPIRILCLTDQGAANIVSLPEPSSCSETSVLTSHTTTITEVIQGNGTIVVSSATDGSHQTATIATRDGYDVLAT